LNGFLNSSPVNIVLFRPKIFNEIGKFKFIGCVLKPTTVLTLTVTFDGKSTIVDTISVTSISLGGSGEGFFKAGKTTAD
jgi:hypothetical protein